MRRERSLLLWFVEAIRLLEEVNALLVNLWGHCAWKVVTNMRLGSGGFCGYPGTSHITCSLAFSTALGDVAQLLQTTVLICARRVLAYEKPNSFRLLAVDDGASQNTVKLFSPDCGSSLTKFGTCGLLSFAYLPEHFEEDVKQRTAPTSGRPGLPLPARSLAL